MEKLDERIKMHDKDIERMCNHHYQGFIDSIRELLQVRSQAQELNVGSLEFTYLVQFVIMLKDYLFRQKYWSWTNA